MNIRLCRRLSSVLLVFFSAFTNAVSPPARIGINGSCTIGSLTDNLRICASGLTCVLTKQGRPEIDIPNVGSCKPQTAPKCQDPETKMFWAPNVIVKKPKCNHCACLRSSPTSSYTFKCNLPRAVCAAPLKPPCQGAKCFGYPTAKCRLEPCSQCTTEWYIGDLVVECKKPPPPPPKGVPVNGACTVGSLVPKNCAAGLVCVLNKQGQPEVDIPNEGICKPPSAPKCQDPETRMYWAPEVIVKKPKCNNCACTRSSPTSSYKFQCNLPVAMCMLLKDPCQGEKCFGYPTAKCRLERCSQCTAEWYIGDRVVQCKKPPPPPPKGVPLNGACNIGSLVPKNCAAGLVCVLNKQGRPEIDIPNEGICRARSAPRCQDPETKLFWAPNFVVKKPNCISCRCFRDTPTSKYQFSCNRLPVCKLIGDPCKGKTCRGYPAAKCRLDTCTACNAEWYIGNEIVTCKA